MADYHSVDIMGCDYAMDIVLSYPNTITDYSHTENEYEGWDMNWTATINGENVKFAVEGKDRTLNWKTKKPQYIHTYPTAMFNVKKYEELMTKWRAENEWPIYMASYTDGVLLYALNRLPEEEITECVREAREAYDRDGTMINNKWCGWYRIATSTIEEKEKKWQLRLSLPLPTYENNYGKILWKRDGKDEQ